MAEKDKKYYWLKLKRDFFKHHDIRILESMENGKIIVLFYLKMLCESVDHDGNLRFSDSVPYSSKMLAAITDTEETIVIQAMDILSELHLITVLDDGTIYMNGVEKMTGSETYWAEKKRQKKESQVGESQTDVGNFPTQRRKNPTSPSKSIENKSIENKSIECECDNNTHTRVEESDLVPKNCYGKYQNVFLTNEEYSDLSKELGETMLKKCIEFLSGYVAETNKTYNNHANTIKRWVVDAVKERETKASGKGQPSSIHYANERSYDYDKLFEQFKVN